MKTIREIVENCAEDYYPYHEYSGAYEDDNKESLDQALKEISELLLEVKPEVIHDGLVDLKDAEITFNPKAKLKEAAWVTKDYYKGYRQAIDDYEKNIKARLQ